ncbi:hypothetical protein TNCV_4993761 [Trichonephila clavipes]|nr:hypothetical protein TNCV_4993761 [Trichonephila clavipes]
MPSPIQSNCDAHDTIANGQYGAVWSMGHTQQNLGGRTGKILRPRSVPLESKNQEINRLQLAVKLPWAIFFESVDILS